MPFLFRRIAETFAASILCSVPVVMLIIIKIIPSTKLACFFAILLSAIIFLFINIVRLRMHISIVEDKAAYYRVNTVVFGVYALAATA